MEYSVESVLQQIPGISCVDGDETNLFIGTQDGQLLHYVIHKDDAESDSYEYTYLLASRQDAPGSKPPRAIILLQPVALAAVLANQQLSFYTLPEFAPASGLRTIKDVQGVIQNSTQRDRFDAEGSAYLTVFTKKKIRQVRVSREIVKLNKEVEYAGCLTACQRGSIVCVATKSSYDLLDLDKKAKIPLIPVVQGESNPIGEQYDSFLPRITSVTETEFLLASGSPESSTSMGMFITLEGEITRGTLMYDSYPLRIMAHGHQVISLLSNGTIEVHDIVSQARLQVLPALDVIDIHRSTHAVPVISKRHLERMTLAQNKPHENSTDQVDEKPQATDLNQARKHSDILSSILLSSKSGVSALTSPTRLIMIDSKLDAGDLQSALADADQLARDTPANFAERLFHELAYIHLKAGLVYFSRMLFDDAADNFKKGNIDPRILISFFPEFESHSREARLYAGLIPTITSMPNVDEIIHAQLKETVEDEATLAELEVIVKSNATELLRRYLTTFREKRNLASMVEAEDVHRLFSVVDSTLLRILLQMNAVDAGPKMKAYLREDVEDPSEISSILQESSRWVYLAEFHAKLGDHSNTLAIWRKLVAGDLSDSSYEDDGIARITDYLLNCGSGNDEYFWDYGLWILRAQPESGIQLLMHAIESGTVAFSARAVLDSLRQDEDSSIFRRFLEHLVLEDGVTDQSLTNELIVLYATDLVQRLHKEAIVNFLDTSIKQYRSMKPPKVSYLAFVTDSVEIDGDAEILAFIAQRSKFIDMLQNSATGYDAQAVLDLILQKRDLLLAERILLYGRLSKHVESINLMVHDLQDFGSAEVYCYHGGISLSQIQISSEKSETVAMRRQLFPLLFKQYLDLQDYSLQFMQASQLLNRWGNYMDIADILKLVPDDWSVELISGFLLSALSKLAGDKRDAQIQRSLARTALQRQTSSKFVLLDS